MRAAEDEFLRVKFEGAAMESIAAAAGVAKTTLYSRYATKALLFRALLEDRIEAWSRERRAFDHLLSDDLEARLRSHGRIFLTAMASQRADRLEKLAESGRGGFPEYGRVVYETTIGSMVRYVAGEIVSRPEKARALGKEPYRVAEIFVSALYGWRRAHHGETDLSEDDAAAVADDLVDLIFARSSR